MYGESSAIFYLKCRIQRTLDGLSMTLTHGFILRKSNTEPLVRLNLETRGDRVLLKKTNELKLFDKGL